MEKCSLCDKNINTQKDDWVALIDYQGKKMYAVKFYHNICLSDLLKGKGKIIEDNFKKEMNNMFGGVMKKIQPIMQQISSNVKSNGTIYDIKT